MVSLRRPQRASTTGPVAPAAALVPLATNFDYLTGAFKSAERARQTLAVTTAVGVLAVAATAGLGMHAKSSTTQDIASRDAAAVQAAEIQTRLDRLDRAGGVAADQLRAHDRARHAALKAALGNETDVAALLGKLRASAPAGVEITSVTLAEPAPAPVTPPTNGTQPTPTTPATPAPTAPTAAQPGAAAPGTTGTTTAAPTGTGPKTLTVVGNATSFAKIGAWVRSLQRVSGVRDIEPTWTGGGEALAVTLTATVTSELGTARSRAAVTADEYGLGAETREGNR